MQYQHAGVNVNVAVAITAVVTFLLTVILYTALLVVGFVIRHQANSSKEKYVMGVVDDFNCA